MRWSNRFRDIAYPATLATVVAGMWLYAGAVAGQTRAERASASIESTEGTMAYMTSDRMPADDDVAQLSAD